MAALCNRDDDLKLHQILELVGTFIMLVSVAWEFSIDRQHDDILADWQFEHIETRLDEIHQRQSKIQKNQNAIAEQLVAGSTRPTAYFVDDFKQATSHKGGSKELGGRAEGFRKFRFYMFLLGSIMLLVGKYHECLDKNA